MYIINSHSIQGNVITVYTKMRKLRLRGVKQFYPRPHSTDQDQRVSNAGWSNSRTHDPSTTHCQGGKTSNLIRYLSLGLIWSSFQSRLLLLLGRKGQVGESWWPQILWAWHWTGPQGYWEQPRDWPACRHEGGLGWGVGQGTTAGRAPRAQQVSGIHCQSLKDSTISNLIMWAVYKEASDSRLDMERWDQNGTLAKPCRWIHSTVGKYMYKLFRVESWLNHLLAGWSHLLMGSPPPPQGFWKMLNELLYVK